MVADSAPAQSDRETVGLALRAARKNAGLSTQEGAVAAGISVPLLGSIERGAHSLTSMSAGNLAQLPRAFGLSWRQFLSIIIPVYGDYLPYLREVAVRVEGQAIKLRRLRYAGEIGLSKPDLNGEAEVRAIPDFLDIEDYADEDLIALKITGDSLTCADVKTTIPEGSLALFHLRLFPQAGDVLLLWLEQENRSVLKVYRPGASGHTLLESYNGRQIPVVLIEDNPGIVQGVYVGHLSSGRRSQHSQRSRMPH